MHPCFISLFPFCRIVLPLHSHCSSEKKKATEYNSTLQKFLFFGFNCSSVIKISLLLLIPTFLLPVVHCFYLSSSWVDTTYEMRFHSEKIVLVHTYQSKKRMALVDGFKFFCNCFIPLRAHKPGGCCIGLYTTLQGMKFYMEWREEWVGSKVIMAEKSGQFFSQLQLYFCSENKS